MLHRYFAQSLYLGLQVLRPSAAITALGDVDERLAKVVELRCFVGLSVGEIAELMALDERTIYRDWSLAKAWLHDRLAA